MATGPRHNSFFIRLSTEELEILESLAKETGLTKSDVIRQSIRRWNRELNEKDQPTFKGPQYE
jgi:predicted DNA-binding protein